MNKEIIKTNLNKLLTAFINWGFLYDPQTIEKEWDMLDFKMSIIFLNMWVQDMKEIVRETIKEVENE